MTRFKSLFIRDVGSIAELFIDFSEFGPGIVVVEGANGSGKTFAFVEAPTWLLYGKTVRGLPADGIVRETASRPKTFVRGVLELDDGREVAAERRRPAAFSFGDIGRLGTLSGNQADFEKLLKISFPAFSTSIVFGGPQISSFCHLSEAARKEILENLLDIHRFRDALTKTNETRQKIDQLRDEKTGKLRILEDRLRAVSADAENFKALRDQFTVNYERDLAEAGKKIREVTSVLRATKKEIWSLKKLLKKRRKRQEALDDLRAKRTERLKKTLLAALEIEVDARANFRVAENELRSAKEYHARLKGPEPPDVCPFCRTPRALWPDPQTRPVSEEGPTFRLEEATIRFKSAKKTLLAAERNADTTRDASETEKRPVDDDYTTLSKKQQNARQRIAAIRVELEHAQKHLRNLIDSPENPYEVLFDKKHAEIKLLRKRVRANRNLTSRLAHEADIYGFWGKHFSREGLPKLLLDEAAPFLTERSRIYAGAIIDGRIDISFDPTAATRGQTFVPQIVNADGGSSYAKCSKGERARIDLCLLLALRDLMESRGSGGFPQMFLDEVFDGLDDEGTERVMTTLRKLFPEKTIFLITHNPALRALADKVIEVSKIDGNTVLRTA